MCRALGVSKSGFYDWKNRFPSERRKFNLLLVRLIKEIYEESSHTYGSPRIHKEIQRKGYKRLTQHTNLQSHQICYNETLLQQNQAKLGAQISLIFKSIPSITFWLLL
ncbi:IS3 family transposase [Leptospira kobayashii]|uniref:IS3 family transposase n=1 Tax=Leptospira kobayashii TaxID=1917830 RepID=UPI000D59D42D